MSSAHAGSVSRREGWRCGRGEAATDEWGPDGHSVPSTGRCPWPPLVSSKMDVGHTQTPKTLFTESHSSPELAGELLHPPVNPVCEVLATPLRFHGVSRQGSEGALFLTVHHDMSRFANAFPSLCLK